VPPRRAFDIADVYRGPVADPGATAAAAVPLDEKLRQACFWIVNTAIISLITTSNTAIRRPGNSPSATAGGD
jgi:hypothetical protein